MSHVVVFLIQLIEIKRKENEEKKEKKRKKGKEASVADFVICLLAYESRFFNFCLPDHLLEGRKEN